MGHVSPKQGVSSRFKSAASIKGVEMIPNFRTSIVFSRTIDAVTNFSGFHKRFSPQPGNVCDLKLYSQSNQNTSFLP